MNEIENANAMKANATRGNVYTLTNTSNMFQINQQQQAWGKKGQKIMRRHIHKLAR